MAAGKGGDFVAVAAAGHGAPTAAVGARGVVEKKAAAGIGAEAKWGGAAFDDNFGTGAGDGSEEPIEAAVLGDKFDVPTGIIENEFIVALGDAQNIVDGFDGRARRRIATQHGGESGLESGVKTAGAHQERACAVGIGIREREELCATLGGDDFGGEEKVEKFVPGKIGGTAEFVGEVESEATADKGKVKVGLMHEVRPPGEKRKRETGRLTG